MKKIRLLLIGTLLSITICASAEIFASGSCGANAKWAFDLDAGLLTIYGSGDISNYISKSNAPWYYYHDEITSIDIRDGITSIGDYAFSELKITRLSIPNSVKTIGYCNFSDCTSLTSVVISDYVTSIGVGAFENCTNLKSLQIGKRVETLNGFDGCIGLTSLEIPNSVTSIDAFDGCTRLTSLIIPDNVTSITGFYNCTSLSSISIPHHVKIFVPAFNNCPLKNVELRIVDWSKDNHTTALSKSEIYSYRGAKIQGEFAIPDGVTKIGSWALAQCSDISKLIIPNSVEAIGDYAFSGTSIKSVEVGNSVTLGFGVFSECNNLTSISIPLSMSSTGNSTYANCLGLTDIVIPNHVTSIGEGSFTGCRNLRNVVMPNSVTLIGETAFNGCVSLTTMKLPKSLISIDTGAFLNCSNITSINLPCSLLSIRSSAFGGCTKLKEIIADGINAPTTDYSFSSVKNCVLHVPLGSEGAYASNFGTYFKSGNSYGNTIVPYSAYFKNSAGEYSFEVWDASSDVELSEGADKVYVPVEATVNDLQYKRTFNNTDWQALYVPFELDVKNDLAGFNVYEVSTSSADAINVTLITEGKTSANTPYLIKAKATGEQTIPVSSKTVKVTVENTNSDLSDFEIVGTYEKLNYGDIDGDWYALKGGKFMKAGEGAFLNPYRFYL
ncbi:MAG: leucine-rich repeat domain-containing protein, partial [Bacteroidaceae bacterium]|nr:leucine-rich repeat domain-containing protein [Bacteroidaceae bacterium]